MSGAIFADQSISSRKVDLTVSQAEITTASQTTTSTSFTDLATVGPSITLSPGITQDHLLTLSARNNGTTNNYVATGVSIAGATTNSENTNTGNAAGTGLDTIRTRQVLATAQTTGATHTLKYSTSAGTGIFNSRRLIGVCI